MKRKAQRSPKYARRFGVLAIGALTAAFVAENAWLRALEINAALAFAGVALGYSRGWPGVFGKRGARLAWSSWPVFWPYFALNHLSLWFFRRTTRENPCDEIIPGLWLGCRLTRGDERLLPPLAGVLDLTAEFDEVRFWQGNPHYLCVPVLDTTAPTIEDLGRGVKFLCERAPHGPVYVHCALGHGRSATFAAAYLFHVGYASSVDAAIAQLKTTRESIDLHAEQLALLQQYEAA